MSKVRDDHMDIEVSAHYVEGQSDPSKERFVFSYSITIRNISNSAAKLMSRKWVITDANGKQEEVQGPGVIGEQPHMEPGEGYRYTSGAVLRTPVGSMYGFYTMREDNGDEYDAPIPAFTLAVPGILH